jgi:hypothetical protein
MGENRVRSPPSPTSSSCGGISATRHLLLFPVSRDGRRKDRQYVLIVKETLPTFLRSAGILGRAVGSDVIENIIEHSSLCGCDACPKPAAYWLRL